MFAVLTRLKWNSAKGARPGIRQNTRLPSSVGYFPGDLVAADTFELEIGDPGPDGEFNLKPHNRQTQTHERTDARGWQF